MLFSAALNEDQIDAMLTEKIGPLIRQKGRFVHATGAAPVDYIASINDEETARKLVQDFRERGIAAGMRAEKGFYTLRFSRNDVMRAHQMTPQEETRVLEIAC